MNNLTLYVAANNSQVPTPVRLFRWEGWSGKSGRFSLILPFP